MTNIAIFASGNGTNCENIIRYFTDHKDININLVISNKQDAYVLTRASKYNVPCKVLTKAEINNAEIMLSLLKENDINFIVLAGFLLMIPDFLIENFENRIINIHPSLLPKFGGKGMYGHHVHDAVKAAKENRNRHHNTLCEQCMRWWRNHKAIYNPTHGKRHGRSYRVKGS